MAHMAPRGKIATMRDVPIKHRRGEYAGRMARWREGKQCKEAMQSRADNVVTISIDDGNIHVCFFNQLSLH